MKRTVIKLNKQDILLFVNLVSLDEILIDTLKQKLESSLASVSEEISIELSQDEIEYMNDSLPLPGEDGVEAFALLRSKLVASLQTFTEQYS